MYVGLGNPVAAVATIVSIEKKLANLFGHATETLLKHGKEVIAKYNAALPPTSDPVALQWLFEKSGGLDAVGVNINFNKYTGKGWKPKDFFGAYLAQTFIYAMGFRTLTYDYYADAAAQNAKPVIAPGAFGHNVRLNNIETPTYIPTNKAPLLVLEHPVVPPPSSGIKSASLLGMDLGSPTTLASLGFIALAFILRER